MFNINGCERINKIYLNLIQTFKDVDFEFDNKNEFITFILDNKTCFVFELNNDYFFSLNYYIMNAGLLLYEKEDINLIDYTIKYEKNRRLLLINEFICENCYEKFVFYNVNYY